MKLRSLFAVIRVVPTKVDGLQDKKPCTVTHTNSTEVINKHLKHMASSTIYYIFPYLP